MRWKRSSLHLLDITIYTNWANGGHLGSPCRCSDQSNIFYKDEENITYDFKGFELKDMIRFVFWHAMCTLKQLLIAVIIHPFLSTLAVKRECHESDYTVKNKLKVSPLLTTRSTFASWTTCTNSFVYLSSHWSFTVWVCSKQSAHWIIVRHMKLSTALISHVWALCWAETDTSYHFLLWLTESERCEESR